MVVASAPSKRSSDFQPNRVWNETELGKKTASIQPCSFLLFGALFICFALFATVELSEKCEPNTYKSQKVISRQKCRCVIICISCWLFCCFCFYFNTCRTAPVLLLFKTFLYFFSSDINVYGRLVFFAWIRFRNNGMTIGPKSDF